MSGVIARGTLYVVSTPIGNLDDMTLRAAAVLREVDLIAAEDTRKTGFLLDHLGIRKPMVSYHRFVEAKRTPRLLGELEGGKSVALVTDAGTPGVSDPAAVVIGAAIARGVPVVPVPGPSALLAALVASGLPMERFVFEGFLPVKKGRRTRWEALQGEERTIILYESPFRVLKTLEEILEHLGDRPVCVARELTKKFEEVERGTVSAVLALLRGKPTRGEYVLVIGGSRAVTVPFSHDTR